MITPFKKKFSALLNSKSSTKTQPWKVKLHYNVFYARWNKNTFLTKKNMINRILLVLLLLVSMLLLNWTVFSLVTFAILPPIVSYIDSFNYDLVRFLCDLLSPVVPDDYSCKGTFSFVSQIKNTNLLFPTT